MTEKQQSTNKNSKSPMSIQQLVRCNTIIKDIRKGNYPSMEDLNTSVNKVLVTLGEFTNEDSSTVVGKTIKRDIKAIRNLLQIDIEFSASLKGYYIDEEQFDQNEYEALIEALNIVYVLQNMENVKSHISFERRKTKLGTHHFLEILNAIRDKKKINFKYTQYDKEETTDRVVSPLGLKEFKGFWYLVAKDEKGIKTFGLDRIENVIINRLDNADYPKDFSLEEYYKDCYGIVRFDNDKPQDILIKMLPIKAKYYEANPLHHSQEIIEKNDKYVIIKIHTYLTYDLQQELRSHGEDEVSIIQPEDGLRTKGYYSPY